MSGYRVVPRRWVDRITGGHVLGFLCGLWLVLAVASAYRSEADTRDARRRCDAAGGVLVRLEGGEPLCLWAGAVIPLEARR